MTEEKVEELNAWIKRWSVLKQRKAKIDEEMSQISESALETMQAADDKHFISSKGRISVVERTLFEPLAGVKRQLAQMRDKAKALGHGIYSTSLYVKFTVN